MPSACKHYYYFSFTIPKRLPISMLMSVDFWHHFRPQVIFHPGGPTMLLGVVLEKRIWNSSNCDSFLSTGASRFDHISPHLYQLHWLPVYSRIHFKVLIFIYNALNDHAPLYIRNLLSFRNQSYKLRFNSDILHQPIFKLSFVNERHFSAVGPRLWNNLPIHIRNSQSFNKFKSNLKTHIFTLAFKNYL